MHEHVVLKVARKNSFRFIGEKEIPIVCLVSSASRRLTFFSASVQLCRLLCKKNMYLHYDRNGIVSSISFGPVQRWLSLSDEAS